VPLRPLAKRRSGEERKGERHEAAEQGNTEKGDRPHSSAVLGDGALAHDNDCDQADPDKRHAEADNPRPQTTVKPGMPSPHQSSLRYEYNKPEARQHDVEIKD
jgi:hypothetical protein